MAHPSPPHPPTLPSLLLLLFLSFLLPSPASSQGFFSSLLHPCAYNPSAISDLTAALNASLVGQELARSSVLDLLASHIDTIDRASKPLVLSFHGMTGTGKTLLSTLIASHLFFSPFSSSPSPTSSSAPSPITPSPHAHHFHGQEYSDPTLIPQLKRSLFSTLLDHISHCPLSLFIFEEVHFMHPDTLPYLLPFFSYHARHDQLDLTQAVYIFTSNIAGKAIQRVAVDAERQSTPRHLIAYPTLTAAIHSAFTGQQGGQLQLLVQHAVVNRYVAFFPLFKSHVKRCVELELEGRRRDMVRGGEVYDVEWEAEVVALVARGLEYVGPISVSGCKGVKDLVTTQVLGEVRKRNRLVEGSGWWRRKRWTLDEYRVKLRVEERGGEGGGQGKGEEGGGGGEEEEEVGVEEVVVVELEKVNKDGVDGERTAGVLERVQALAGGLGKGVEASAAESGGAASPVTAVQAKERGQPQGKAGVADVRRSAAKPALQSQPQQPQSPPPRAGTSPPSTPHPPPHSEL